MASKNKGSNGYAIVGFILSIIGGLFLSLIGIALSFVGVYKSDDYKSGKTISIIGIIIGTIKVVIIAYIIISLLLGFGSKVANKGYCKTMDLVGEPNKICKHKDDDEYDCFITTCKFEIEDKKGEEKKEENKEIQIEDNEDIVDELFEEKNNSE